MNRHKHSMYHCNPFWPTLEENLCRWVKMQSGVGNPISTIRIWLKVKIMVSEIRIVDLKGGSNWNYHFMWRNNLCIWMKMTGRDFLEIVKKRSTYSNNIYILFKVKKQQVKKKVLGKNSKFQLLLDFKFPNNWSYNVNIFILHIFR